MALPYPTQIEQPDPASLLIVWSDGQRRTYTVRDLRDNCPCATCREKHGPAAAAAPAELLPVLSPEEAQPLRIQSMRPVGNYAYSILFSDGHDSGIYTFEQLLSESGRSKRRE